MRTLTKATAGLLLFSSLASPFSLFAAENDSQSETNENTKQLPENSSVSNLDEEGGGAMLTSQSDPLFQFYLYDTGSISANSRIQNLSGSFTHSIPITVPPGRNGIQPNLSFSYNSQENRETNSIGYGWDIPIPYIERVNKTGVEDVYSANFFSSSLSGELATTSDPSAFLALSDDGSFLQYVFASSTNRWTVTDKDGTIYKFGHSSTTRQDDSEDETRVYRWMLEEVRDLNGNYARYEYYKDNGFIYPNLITYTGNGVTDGVFTIEFSLETRTDTATSTSYGFEVEARYRIDEVTVSTDGTWTRQYDLSYSEGDNDQRSLLESIVESGQAFDTGSSVVSTLPATTFGYKTVKYGWATTTNTFSLPHKFRDGEADTGVRIFDVNGDALPDIVRAKEGTTTETYINDGDGWNLDGA